MIFSSFDYFCFLAIAFAAYWMLHRVLPRAGRVLLLTALSFVFYGWASPKMIVYLAISIVVNYFGGRVLTGCRRGKVWLAVLIILNCIPLVYFKYTNFFLSTVGAEPVRLALPLGISYITFVQIAYLVDTWRSKTAASFLDCAFHVSFWPKLVSGPITRGREIIPQLHTRWCSRFRSQHVYAGLIVFFIGLGKKLLIADPLASVANWGWSASNLDCASSWLTTVCYTLQLYFDFSGYSDMAWGSAMLFNIRLPWNFNSPYKATSIQDFWRRWHISLSLWLRDYLYFTFGGSRCSLPKTLRNCFLTFLIGGIWHGAGWTFVVWGALHGLALSVCQLWKKLCPFRIPRPIGWLLTMLFVHFAWIYFRAPDFASANRMVASMLACSLGGEAASFDWSWSASWFSYFVLAVSIVFLALPNSIDITKGLFRFRSSWRWQLFWGATSAFLLFSSILRLSTRSIEQTPFVYFQF